MIYIIYACTQLLKRCCDIFPRRFFALFFLLFSHWVHCTWTHSSTKMWTNLMWHTSDAWFYLSAGTHTFVYFMTVITWTALINRHLTRLFFYVKACDVLFNFKLWGVGGRGASFLCLNTLVILCCEEWRPCLLPCFGGFCCCCCENGPFFVRLCFGQFCWV